MTEWQVVGVWMFDCHVLLFFLINSQVHPSFCLSSTMFTEPLLIPRVNTLENKSRKMKKWKNKKQISKIPKTQKQNKMEQNWRKKGKTKKHNKRVKNERVHLHLACIYVAFSICFFCFVFAFILLVCFFPGKSKKNKIKGKKQIEKAKKMRMDKSIIMFPLFFPFWISIFSQIFCFLLIFSVLKICFWLSICFPFFSFCFAFFKFKNHKN